MLSTKDGEGFLRNFSGLARRVIAVPIHQDKAMPAAHLADIAKNIGFPAIPRDDIESREAVERRVVQPRQVTRRRNCAAPAAVRCG